MYIKFELRSNLEKYCIAARSEFGHPQLILVLWIATLRSQ
jgi:hypothetical protein